MYPEMIMNGDAGFADAIDIGIMNNHGQWEPQECGMYMLLYCWILSAFNQSFSS